MILALKIGEIFSIGGLTTFLGISITFLTLSLLVVCLIAMDKIMNIKKENKDSSQEEMIISKIQEDDSVVAAIVAALNLVMTSEAKSQNKARASFVVKSIKRI